MGTRKRPRTSRKPRASTRDIVGALPPRPAIKVKWRKHYERLLKLRDYLLRLRSDLTQDALQELPSVSMHLADAGTDTYDRDFALGMLSSDQDAVYQIDQALDRIRNGPTAAAN